MMIYTLELLVFVLVMVIVMDNCSREAVMMIPAKTRPSTWTLEYSGYLMAEASAWSDRYNYYTKTFNGKSLLG